MPIAAGDVSLTHGRPARIRVGDRFGVFPPRDSPKSRGVFVRLTREAAQVIDPVLRPTDRPRGADFLNPTR